MDLSLGGVGGGGCSERDRGDRDFWPVYQHCVSLKGAE